MFTATVIWNEYPDVPAIIKRWYQSFLEFQCIFIQLLYWDPNLSKRYCIARVETLGGNALFGVVTREKLFQGLDLFVLRSACHRGGFQVNLSVGEHLWIRIVSHG